VRYPGLATDPAHATAKDQMIRFGSLLGITFKAKSDAERFIRESRFVRAVTSFGGVHTSAERRARWGDQVHEGFVRLSIGCEPAEVLWTDMKRVIDGV
jgi:cystathionine gamma-lyase